MSDLVLPVNGKLDDVIASARKLATTRGVAVALRDRNRLTMRITERGDLEEAKPLTLKANIATRLANDIVELKNRPTHQRRWLRAIHACRQAVDFMNRAEAAA